MFGDYSLGLELHSDAGMSNMDVIKSATGEAAKGLGMIDQIGTLEVGKEADLIVVENDPLKDIKAMREMQLVIRAGREILPYKTNER
jgi:imidazolonepropionase-like amidohydrolase